MGATQIFIVSPIWVPYSHVCSWYSDDVLRSWHLGFGVYGLRCNSHWCDSRIIVSLIWVTYSHVCSWYSDDVSRSWHLTPIFIVSPTWVPYPHMCSWYSNDVLRSWRLDGLLGSWWFDIAVSWWYLGDIKFVGGTWLAEFVTFRERIQFVTLKWSHWVRDGWISLWEGDFETTFTW